MKIDQAILTQLLVSKDLLDKELENYKSEAEKKAFINGIHKAISMVFATR